MNDLNKLTGYRNEELDLEDIKMKLHMHGMELDLADVCTRGQILQTLLYWLDLHKSNIKYQKLLRQQLAIAKEALEFNAWTGPDYDFWMRIDKAKKALAQISELEKKICVEPYYHRNL